MPLTIGAWKKSVSGMERFVDELQPRDVVTKAILAQMEKDGTEHVWEDLRPIPREELLNHFPNIVAYCREHGYDPETECIPVVPAQHYFMGGVKVDSNSATSMRQLYAIGETACNGVHGKNRLASNSLLEALVFSRRAAEDIKRCMANGFAKVQALPAALDFSGAPLPDGIVSEIRSIMQRAYFVLPDAAAIRFGLKQIDNILKRLKGGKYACTREWVEALSLATAAYIVLKEADEKI